MANAVYKGLAQLGFTGGNVLDPCTGTGNFIGYMPSDMKENSTIYCAEIDDLSSRIAKQLYPSAKISACGFEELKSGKGFYDVAVGNAPFGDMKVFDAEYNRHNFLIHDYFFAKAIDSVRPGGIVAFITSKGTMDKKDSRAREYPQC